MAQYSVRANDTPASIAARFTGSPSRMKELVAANPHKALVNLYGQRTFRSMGVGERLNLPRTWIGLGAAPQGVGQGLGACTPVTMTVDQAWAAISTAITNSTVQCNMPSGGYTPDQNICNFQAAYQAWAPTVGLPPIPNDASGAAPIDGDCGPNTITAINAYLNNLGTGYSVACNNNALTVTAPVTPPNSGGGGTTPPTPGGGGVVTPPTTTVTSSSMTGLLIAGAALAAALGGYYWLRHKGGAKKLQAGAAKVRGHLRRGGRRIAARRRLRAARRRR